MLPRSGPGTFLARLVLTPLLLVALLATLTAGSSLQAQTVGATLTILRGSTAVLRADGTPLSPAASGLTLGVGDQVATLAGGSGLVTFFDGSEIELGAETTIVIRDMSQRGSATTITVESVVGTTLHRVVTLTDPGSSYRVEAGGTVALVRGTVFAEHVDPGGDITVAVGEGVVDFPQAAPSLRRGEKRTVTSRGDIIDGKFDPATSLFTTVVEPTGTGNPSGTENPGLGTGSSVAPQQQSLQPQDSDGQEALPPASSPGHTFLVAAAPAGATRLDVDSTAGFAVGDVILVDAGASNQTRTITGFGSILIQPPLDQGVPTGAPVDLVRSGGQSPTPTVTPSATLGLVGTIEPSPSPTPSATLIPARSPTVTPSPTASPTATSVASASPTATATASPTATATSTATTTTTATPTATPTATATATSTATATPTNTDTPTPTATATPTLTPTPTFPCLGPLDRVLATRGGGSTGTTRGVTAGGIRLTLYLVLTDAEPDTAFDVYIDIGGGSAGIHRLVGTVTTDDAGDATFTGAIVEPTVAAQIDNEVILHGDSPNHHQYIRELFTPCPE